MLDLLRNSVLSKVIGLLLLMLLLCLPLSSIERLTQERGDSRREAAKELALTYTGAQTLVGPLLVVPYTERWTEIQRDTHGNITGSVTRSKAMRRVVFPQQLHVEGRLQPEERYRGIFRIPFYSLDATLSGGFPAFAASAIAPTEADSQIELKTPFISLHTSDLRGLSGSPALSLSGQSMPFAQRVPGLEDASPRADGIHALLTGAASVAWQAGQALPFTLKLGLVGQETLSIVPVAAETTAHLVSPWPHPRFGGRFLATERSVGDDGFDARWRISSLVTSAQDQVNARMFGRGDAAQARAVRIDAAADSPEPQPSGELQSFDVSLAEPLNVYAMSARAGKYGAMFVGLVLMAAFMFELFRKLRLHPVQYVLVGLSIAMFFLLLLALSEKVAFWLAYTGAAGSSVALLGIYFSALLGNWRRGASFAAYVAVLYAALYGLLASESNALLLGALLVFGMLAMLMLATRKVDWYALGAGMGTARSAPPTVATEQAGRTSG